MADISVDPFTWSTTAGSNAPSGSTVIGGGLDDNLRAMQAGVKMTLDSLSSVAGTNTITAIAVGLTAYSSGQSFEFTPAATNTGATTINVTSLGAKNVFFNGAACVGGELVINVPTRIKYDGTQFNIIGPVIPATQTQQEASTSNSVFVTPGRQQFHPSAAKGWCQASTAGAATSSYNVSSVTDTGVGDATVNWTVSFSSGNYCAIGSCIADTNLLARIKATGFAAGSAEVLTPNLAASLQDPNFFTVVAFGDQ